MQTASAAFAAAAYVRRAWMPPRVRTDWAGDGYDGNHTIDDLSPQVGTQWSVDHNLDDGYPNTVAFVSGEATPTISIDLTGRTVGGVRVTAPAYWSPLRTDSPIYGYARDLAPVTLDMGLVTGNGPEYVPVFTGQMVSTPLKAGKASLSGISATRVALMKPVQPPAVANLYASTITASWVVSWCLYKCGIYAGPRPRPGTAAYLPFHGGLWRFHDGGYPGGNLVQISATSESWTSFTVTPTIPAGTSVYPVSWIQGPYVAAPDLHLTASESKRVFSTKMALGDSSDTAVSLLSKAGAAARLEMWIRGDSADVNHAPGGSGTVSRLAGFQVTADTGATTPHPYMQMGVNTSRQVYVTVWDLANTRTLTSSATLPTDGAWHFVGAAYDMVADKLWVNLDGVVQSTAAVMTDVNLPATDTWDTSDGSPFFVSYLPVSDITVTGGVQANPDSYPLWRNDASFAPTATVGLSMNELTGVGEMTPREAWQIIGGYAQSELAMMRCDELDTFQYLPLGHWVRDEQQAVADILDTARNAGPFDVDFDPTRIRTSIKVTYTKMDLPGNSVTTGIFRRTYELGSTASSGAEILLPVGVSDLRFTFQTPVLYLYRNIAADDGLTAAADSLLANASYVTLNTSPDGTGTEYSTLSSPPASITITVLSWDPGGATIRFVNGTGVALYFANDNQCPVMCLTGIPAVTTQTYVQAGDDGGARGERFLEVQATGIQRELSARRLAQNLLSFLREPMATIGDEQGGITVTADPRRQPGDLVGIVDRETGVSGALWRLQAVRHKGDNASYTQEVVARQVYPIAVVGQGVVGLSLVGPSSD